MATVHKYKIATLGDGGVGKSCLTIQFIQNLFVAQYDPTIENMYRKNFSVDDQPVILEILDTAGQEEYVCMRGQYMRPAQGFVLVFSITSRRSYEELLTYYEDIQRVKDGEKVPIVVCGNKADLADSREVSQNEGEELARSFGDSPYFETSAKTRLNVDLIFQTIVRMMRQKDGVRTVTGGSSGSGKSSGRRGCAIL